MSQPEPELWVTLSVHNRQGDMIQSRRINFLSREGRQKIAKTAWWAMHEGHELRTRPWKDEKK